MIMNDKINEVYKDLNTLYDRKIKSKLNELLSFRNFVAEQCSKEFYITSEYAITDDDKDVPIQIIGEECNSFNENNSKLILSGSNIPFSN